MSTALVVGATGATGRRLVEQLLDRGQQVRAIVRSPSKLKHLEDNPNLTLIQGAPLDMSDTELAEHVKGCDAVASCLGHNLNFKGLYGKPRRLVTDTARRLCKAIKTNAPGKPVKYVLMNTTGNSNRDLNESVPLADRIVVGILRHVLPPHADNEQAADYLRVDIGQHDQHIQWVAVRPDNLIDNDEVSEYDLHPSPTRSAIFKAGQTSRINVGNFMARLITEEELWSTWKGQMPVIYNRAPVKPTTAVVRAN